MSKIEIREVDYIGNVECEETSVPGVFAGNGELIVLKRDHCLVIGLDD